MSAAPLGGKRTGIGRADLDPRVLTRRCVSALTRQLRVPDIPGAHDIKSGVLGH